MHVPVQILLPEVAHLMAEEFGYDKKWEKEQIESYNKLIANYL